MSSNIFSEGVCDNIGAKKEWVLVDGGHESVVDNQKCAMSFASLADFLDVEHFKGWVGGGLEPDHLGVRSELLLEGVDVGEVLKGKLNVGVWSKNAAQVSLGAAIDVIYAEDMVTLAEHVHQCHVGGHS